MNKDNWLKELEVNGIKEDWNVLIPDIQKMIIDSCFSHGIGLLLELQKCESPIEWKLGIAMSDYFQLMGFANGSYVINPQNEIETVTGKYRVDFLIIAILENVTDMISTKKQKFKRQEINSETALLNWPEWI
jgi:hypothetical protein